MIAALQDQSFQSQRVRKGYACVMKRFLLLLIATSASSLSCVGRWDISAAKMSNWLTEEGSEFMNAVSSRCAAFVASRREFAWRIVWDR